MPARKGDTSTASGSGRAKASATVNSRGRPAGAARGGARGGRSARTADNANSSENEDMVEEVGSRRIADEDDEDDPRKTIPPELLTRLLHEFFTKDGTRITQDANAAVALYMDTFVREAIARSAAERSASFMEVEDLEKIAPQLLLDL